MGMYEFLVRRYNLLRFLFGMKPLPARQATPALDRKKPDLSIILIVRSFHSCTVGGSGAKQINPRPNR